MRCVLPGLRSWAGGPTGPAGPGPAGPGPGPGRQGPCAAFFFGGDFLKKVVLSVKNRNFQQKLVILSNKSLFSSKGRHHR